MLLAPGGADGRKEDVPGAGEVYTFLAAIHGDVNCGGTLDTLDALGIIRDVGGLPALAQNEPCPDVGAATTPIWGDLNCDGFVNALDPLAALRIVAGLSELPKTEPCPTVGRPAFGTKQ